MIKRVYFIGLAFGCAVLLLGCTNREKDQINDPDTPAITDSTGLTEGATDVAGQDADQTGKTTDSQGQSSNLREEAAETAGQTAVSAGKSTDSSGAVSGNNSGQQMDSDDQSGEIGIEAAKKIALTKAGLTEQDGSWKEEKRDREDGRIVYELEFVSGKKEYEFEIDAQNGTILKYQQESIYD